MLTHLRPLDQSEVQQLGVARRNKEIRQYLSFADVECSVDMDFKKRMNPNGSFYELDESLSLFPPAAAALLKYKKHEWVIIAFEKGKKVESMWLNKGPDRSSVSIYLPVEDIADISTRNDYTTVLIFHNHPNSNPSQLDCTQASETDLRTANKFAHVLNAKGVNLVKFVCERGSHYEYFFSPAESFVPLLEVTRTIEASNGRSGMSNFSLHCERLF